MADGLFWLLLILAFFLIMAVTVGMAVYFRRFNEDMKNICREMDNSDSDEDYQHRRREPFCHYLTLTPFESKRNAAFACNFLHKGNHVQKEARADSILPLLMPSILGLSVCFVCMIGMTFAWFTANSQVSMQSMESARFDVTVESIKNGETDIEPSADGYSLSGGVQYTVRLRTEGTVKNCGGYCIVENSDKSVKLYTDQLTVSETSQIDFTPPQDGVYTFTGVWGGLPADITQDDMLTAADAVNIQNEPAEISEDAAAEPENAVTSDEPTDLNDEFNTAQSGDTSTDIAEGQATTIPPDAPETADETSGESTPAETEQAVR